MLKVFEKSKLSHFAIIDEKDAGNHFLMRINTSLSDTELKWLARENGIKLDCLSEYCESEKELHSHTVIVNYSDIDEIGFSKALDILYSAMFS
jgi:GntR family transcriptional regulator/MocR family aminotransferase